MKKLTGNDESYAEWEELSGVMIQLSLITLHYSRFFRGSGSKMRRRKKMQQRVAVRVDASPSSHRKWPVQTGVRDSGELGRDLPDESEP